MYLTQIGTKTKKPALYLLGKPRPKDEICVKYILPSTDSSYVLKQILHVSTFARRSKAHFSSLSRSKEQTLRFDVGELPAARAPA
jgi:hypothetical protein